MTAFRRPKSLKDILVRAKVKPRKDSPKGESKPCNTSRCQTCRLIHIAQTFKSKYGAISTIKECHTCKTSKAVYLMKCNICNKQYVGETSMALNKRMDLHKSDWKTRQFNRFQWREALVWKYHVLLHRSQWYIDRWATQKEGNLLDPETKHSLPIWNQQKRYLNSQLKIIALPAPVYFTPFNIHNNCIICIVFF